MRKLVFSAAILVLATIIFLPVWLGGTLMTTDDNIGNIAGYKALLSDGFGKAGWSESPLVGMPAVSSPLNWSNLLINYLPVRTFANTFHAITLLAGSMALGIYLFRKNLSLGAVLIAVITAFWLGTNFTLIYAGHIRKFSIVFLFCATLVCLDKLFETKRWNWSVIAGALIAIMFLEQQDVALFFGLFAGAYAVFLWMRSGERAIGFMRLIPIVAIALMICIGPVLTSYRQNVSGVSAMEQSRQEKWEFCTQWSQPPEEIIDFIAPGYMGWRSGEPAGPYWGRMGRSAGWEQTQQGFMNFRLENIYLGIIPVMLAIFALFASKSSPHKSIIRFWAGAAVVALLLSFGKYTPLYALFWQLPVINDIRNPNKFTQIFQICVAILAALGFDAALKEKAAAKKFFWVGVGAFAVMLLWAFGATVGQSGTAAEFSRMGWPSEMARVIAGNQTTAIWHAAIMAAAAALIFALPRWPSLQRHQSKIVAGLVILIAADAAWLSRHYVQKLPQGYIEENAVTRLIKSEPGRPRVAMVTQENFYNLWLTYLFPYHDIAHFNLTQMPRMPADYQQFLSALQRNPLRMWQLAGVSIILGPANIASQLPTNSYEIALRFDVMGRPDGSIAVQENPQGQHAVFRALAPDTRFALVGGAEKLADADALSRLVADSAPLRKIILSGDYGGELLSGEGRAGQVKVVDHRPGYWKVDISATSEAYVRFAEKYDAGWSARLNGQKAEIVRSDYLFQAVRIPAGEHRLEFAYQPDASPSWALWSGLGLAAVSVLGLAVPARKG